MYTIRAVFKYVRLAKASSKLLQDNRSGIETAVEAGLVSILGKCNQNFWEELIDYVP
jgi:hypothetical protein